MTPKQRASAWLAMWDATGIHRTATAGDNAAADWLAAEAAALGATVATEEFAIDRLDPIDAFLEIADARIPAVPVFDAPPTDAAGISGRLGEDLAVVEFTPRAVYSGEYRRLRRASTQRGLVIVCAGEAPGLGLLNAEQFRAPYGAPAIHVASEAREAIFAAATRHAPARLVADSRRRRATARNIVANLPGADRGAAPLIVMTPRSSWWQSTAERGGGIVCWLESLRALLAKPLRRPVIFTANSGHELGHLGLDEFIARRPGWDRVRDAGGATWVLYGANIGAAGGTLSVMSPLDDLGDVAGTELARSGQPHIVAPKEQVPGGETRDLHRAGAHCLAINGTNPLFHLPQDRWPGAIDLAAVCRTASAAVQIVGRLADD